MAKTSVDIPQLKFNKMSTAKYEELKLAGQLNNNEFYITPDGGTIPEVNETTNDFVLSNNGTDLNWVQETEYTKNRIDSKLDDNIRTNCLTKIPQDIKLELNNGTLTLKAGSKMYKGDGSIVNIDSDKTTTGANTTKAIAFYDIESDLFSWRHAEECFSQDSAPNNTQYMLWYDTANKIVKATADTGATWSECALPICEFTADSTQITSIDQIFNGIGYIGNTIFVLPGVEGLIPNGRNDDGSLNNTKCTTTSVLTIVAPDKRNAYIVANGTDVAIPMLSEFTYNQSSNKNLFTVLPSEYCIIGTCDSDSTGRVTSFNPKNVFQAVDRNEADYVVESYKNGSNWYRIYKSGWIEQGGIITVNGDSTTTISLLKAYKDTLYSVTHALKTVIARYDPAITNTSIDSFTITYPSAGGDAIVSWEAKGQGE